MNVKYFIFCCCFSLSTSIRRKKVILTLGLKGKKQMTGCALILVRICERDLYDILHELFKETSQWALVAVNSYQYSAILQFQLLMRPMELLSYLPLNITAVRRKQKLLFSSWNSLNKSWAWNCWREQLLQYISSSVEWPFGQAGACGMLPE